MSNLENAINALVGRIDGLTSRLDALERNLASGAAAGGAAPAAAGSSGGAAPSGAGAAFLKEFQELVDTHIKPLIALSNKFGSAELKKQVGLLEKAIEEESRLLHIASVSAKPSASDAPKLLQNLQKIVGELVGVRDSNRPSPQFNHLSTISEGITALSWVVVEPTPGPFVDEARAASEFYSNKLLVQYKGKDQDQVDWVGHWNNFLKELTKYIKKHHTTGLTWNPKGGSALSAAPAKAGGPPPPPAGGPPPPPPPTAAPGGAAASGPDMKSVFNALNKGVEITRVLRKVEDSEKTKNRPPEERVAVVPSSIEKKAAAAPTAAPTAAGKKAQRPPKFSLEGNKWVVESQVDNKNLMIDQTEPKHTVYIYGCRGSVIQIKGKVNTIIVDDCDRTGLVFENAIATCEIVNSRSVELQVTGKVPAISIDKSSGVQVFLSKASLDAEIVTSKSDQMNVLVPVEGQLDPVELPVPEQYRTVYKNGKLITTTMEHV